MEGLLKALDRLDDVIATIRKSRTVETARANLKKKFKFTDIQAQAILDMQLRRLAALERRKLQDEHKEVKAMIRHLEKLLSRPDLMRDVIKEDLQGVREKYADTRRSQIIERTAAATLTATDLLPDQSVWVLIGEKGTVARTSSPEMIRIPVKPSEQPFALLQANTQDILYLFAADGRVVSLPVYQLPQSQELGKGTHWAELTGFSRRDHLAAAVIRPLSRNGYLFLTSLAGVVKRVRMEDMPGITSDPFTVMNIDKNDSLGWAMLTTGEEEIMLGTAAGQLIRFKEDTVRPMGLAAAGVMGIKLSGDADGVISMDLAQPDTFVWSITDNGMAKATPIDEYPTKGRYGQGVVNVRLPKEAEEVAAVVVASGRTELLVKTAIGSTRKVRVDKCTIGRRSIKPRNVVSVGNRNRITGAVQMTERPEVDDEEETAVPQQLTLLSENKSRKRKKK